METFNKVNHDTKASSDPLLECLIILCKHYGRYSSSYALTSGLALDHNRLTMESFIRAAERVNLLAQVQDLPLQNFSELQLPVVLLLKGHQACVLMEISSDGIAKLIQPENHETIQVSVADLANDYAGTVISISPQHRFDTRVTEASPTQPRQWFWEVMKRAWAVYGEILVASFLINMFALASPLFIMNVYDRVVPNPGTATIWVLASGVFIVFLFDFIMRNLRAYFIDAAGRNIDVCLSRNIFSHLLDIKMGLRPHSVGTLASTVQTFEAFREFVTSATVSVLVDVPFVILFLLTIGFLGGWIVLVPVISIPVVLLFGILVQRPLDDMVRKSHQYSTEKHAVLVETLSSIETVKGMHVEGFMQSRWENVVEAATRLSIKLRTLANLGINFSLFVQQLSIIVLIIAGVYSIQSGHMTVGALVACTILASRALVPVAQIAGLVARYQQCKTAILALDQVMQLPTERPRESSFLYLSQLDGEIAFKNVSFSYPGQQVPALNNVSFHIKPKEKVGIIGATGSGKSTIIKLIMKFYEPASGNVLIDGFEEHQLDPAELRHFIGYVPQDITLFHGTIKENIIFGANHVDDTAVIRAAKLSTVDTFVAQHPEGFNRQVGERGQFLSGGQRQAMVISRALILDPPVLLFDELSNSMDDQMTSMLIERLRAYIGNKTLVLVTHKALMLNLVDRIIVLDKGHVVADGPKDEILRQLAERKVQAAHAK
ncbi:MAG: type I secretion system permease/ATPase [Gammaproteobacteria bacterium]|nr:type I secretion system permease/ATPase [Gammaproteobacteria bacterium]